MRIEIYFVGRNNLIGFKGGDLIIKIDGQCLFRLMYSKILRIPPLKIAGSHRQALPSTDTSP